MKDLVTGQPDWLRVKYNERGGVIKLSGNNTWKDQPVIDRIQVTLTDKFNKLIINKAMLAELRVRNKGADKPKVIFGDQAGTITKRFDTIIDFGKNHEKATFVFKNTVLGDPFNHAQRISIRNFGENDKIILKNIGEKFSYDRLKRFNGIIPGVSPLAINIDSFL